MKLNPRTYAERSEMRELVQERIKNLTPEQKEAAMKRRAPSSASPKDLAQG